MTNKQKLINKVFMITALAFMLSPLSADLRASTSEHKDHHKNSAHSIESVALEKGSLTIKVKGMVCAFCAQGIEKNFKKHKAVKNTKVALDKMLVTVEFHEGKSLTEEQIKKTITDAGFNFVGVKGLNEKAGKKTEKES